MSSWPVSSAGLLALTFQSALLVAQLRDPAFTGVDRRAPRRVVAWVGTNLLAVIAVFRIVDVVFGSWPGSLRVANLAGLFFFAFLGGFQLHCKWMLNYHFLRSTYKLVLYPGSVQVVRARVGTVPLTLYALTAVMLAGAVPGTPGMFRTSASAHPALDLTLASLVLAELVTSRLHVHSAATYLLRSIFDDAFRGGALPDTQERYPYWRTVTGPTAREQVTDRPHVFIVLMESFSANHAGARDSLGREFTPHFNRFAEQGLRVDRFYGNSVHSVRGVLAVMASVVPGSRSKVFDEYPELRLKALPAILKTHGYRTHYFQGAPDLRFENVGYFMHHLGFDEVHGMGRDWFTESDWKAHNWGWGIQDNLLYRRHFQWLDEQHALDRDARYFTVLCPTSNHMMFDRIPRDQQYLYRDVEANRSLQYANSVHLADRYFGEFLEELARRPYLENSIVVVTGDHGFPVGEHGNHFNEVGYHEENFRTPFALCWQGRILPRVAHRTAYCQLDIAPTLLDLLAIDEDHHFSGRTMLAADDAPQATIPLVQPYDSTLLCAVLHPLKYVQQQTRERAELLHDLSADPLEVSNIIERYRGTAELEQLREAVLRIRLNDRLLHENRICPPNPRSRGTSDRYFTHAPCVKGV